VQLSYLQQVKGYADLKTREAQQATNAASEARSLLQQFIIVLSKVYGVEDKSIQILEDWSGFRVGEPPPAALPPQTGHA
jgi:hypothetical protein